MTAKPGTKIKIHSRRGKFHASVKNGWVDFDGFTAMIIIAIILAARFTRVFARVSYRFTIWFVPGAARVIVWLATGLVLWFRAFYTE